MAFCVGAVVANIYYIQPLLSTIAAAFRISVPQVGLVAMLTQFGGALGMLVFVPLGDTKERRRLIVSLLLAECVCLALMAAAQNFAWLALAAFGVGVTTATVHVTVPFAAHLASPERRGATVGAILAGLLFGILLARTFSGLLGAWLGWRAIYFVASALMLLLAVLIRTGLPESQPELKLSWVSLIRSTFGLIRTQPVLRESAALGAIFFCAFNAFWTTLVFFLQTPPYHYGSAVAGLFGLVGAVGAVCAPFVGRMADRYGARRNVLASLLVVLISFIVLYFFGRADRGSDFARHWRAVWARVEPDANLWSAAGGAQPAEYGLHGLLLQRRGAGVLCGIGAVAAVWVGWSLRARLFAAGGGLRGLRGDRAEGSVWAGWSGGAVTASIFAAPTLLACGGRGER
jgi:predicted MFS family arabinose efflux permease